ncbi:mitochondrial ribosomal protein subunit-domain-containing protein [Mycotypha africana]|uniref:mitochondrial ribosomal protein subunit-domain-containing protein n=1 Tax=Mycotypha africana TaxID=64632 RepID=UPI0023002224|nr:mitochondrial ribosomal protein subunit-domain-containing protein [Mycotypha africana]KAI8977264.1 mitochondrial ribosomal protein subunit-domain-containing protein [Mycotypha africana]
MEKSFANILRHSRLATYDRTLEQVYKSPKTYRKIGEWGLKRNLPTVIQTKNLIVNALDTAEHQTPWKSGNSKVLFVKRWKENFPNSRKPRPRSEEDPKINVAHMTAAQFQRLLKSIEKSKAPKFQEQLAKKEVTSDQVFDYINVTFNMNDSTSSSSSAINSTTATTASTGSDPVSTGDGVVGPTYSHYEVDMDYPVEGRLLNMMNDKYAVGIGGIVAYMDKRSLMNYNNSDRSVRQFFIRNAEIDDSGRPNVEVALDTRERTAWSSSIFSEELGSNWNYMNNKFSSNNERSNNSFAGNNNIKTPSVKTDDNIIKNRDHDQVMERISLLLANKK